MAFYLCHHIERLTSKEEEKEKKGGWSREERGSARRIPSGPDEKHRLEKNSQCMRELSWPGLFFKGAHLL